MKFTKNEKRQGIAIIIVVLAALLYIRPRSFESIMVGFYDEPVIVCLATYKKQEVLEDGELVYTTMFKEFDINGEEYKELMEMLTETKYKKQLAPAFIGGKRQSYSIPYPYGNLFFYQEDEVYEIGLYNRYLPMGKGGEMNDYSPQRKRKFYDKVLNFIRDNGNLIDEAVSKYKTTANIGLVTDDKN